MTVRDTDVAGGNWDFGPRHERTNGRYHTPAIIQDASTLRGKVSIRAGYIADYLDVASSHFAANAIANRLRRLQFRWQFTDAHIVRQADLDEASIREHGGRIEDGFRGLWVFVKGLENVRESVEAANDE